MVESIKELVIGLLIVVVLSFCIINFVGQRTIVDGSSMNNTLFNGDNLVVEKVTYRFSEANRFDIMVFRCNNDKNKSYIKRVIGLPGETVQIIDNDIFINGKVIKENYGKEEMQYAGIASEPLKLADDEYFVLGDNRNDSLDSRDPSVGPVKKSWVQGRAFLQITPFSKFGFLKGR